MSNTYKIRIDKTNFDLEAQSLTGTALLALVNKTPDKFKLIQRLHGGQTKPVGPNESVDFTEPGVERFMTLPLDQTEG